jgi:copper chaperone
MVELHVSGMTCNHCVRAVTEAVHSVLPNIQVAVDLLTGAVRVEQATTQDIAALTSAIVAEGYTVP